MCYRPPSYSNCDQFFDILGNVLSQHKNLLLLGDMNYDLLTPSNSVVEDYENLVSSYYFRILNQITPNMATRTTESSASLIDHIISDLDPQNFNHCMINDNILSDHRMILLNLTMSSTRNSMNNKRIKVIDHHHIVNELPKISTESFEKFHHQLITLFKSHTREIELKAPPHSAKKPWFDIVLKKTSHQRDKFYKLHKKFPSNPLISQKLIFFFLSKTIQIASTFKEKKLL